MDGTILDNEEVYLFDFVCWRVGGACVIYAD